MMRTATSLSLNEYLLFSIPLVNVDDAVSAHIWGSEQKRDMR